MVARDHACDETVLEHPKRVLVLAEFAPVVGQLGAKARGLVSDERSEVGVGFQIRSEIYLLVLVGREVGDAPKAITDGGSTGTHQPFFEQRIDEVTMLAHGT